MDCTFKSECPITADSQHNEEKSDVLKLLNSYKSREKNSSTTTKAKLKDVTSMGETNHENEAKSSKVTSLLDPVIKTSIFDESSDFIECSLKPKSKSESDRKEIVCEICKEVITHLDFHNRGLHVNNCIDKEISSSSKTQTNSENVFILECPLCFKQFQSTELRANHIKKCGKSKGLSVQSIVRALELQERHALERISLGLPAKPLKSVKSHKNPVHKKAVVPPKSKADSDIQLAKALSLSLTTSSQQEEVSTPLLTLRPPTVHDRPGKKSKAVLSSTSLLVLRTEEERKRLLLDKVATIVTPVGNSEEESPSSSETVTVCKQKDLDSLVPLLWCLSSKASEKEDYYVQDLIEWIQPSDVEAGAKLGHLSQIAGHEIVTQLPCDYTFSTPESQDKTSAGCETSVAPSVIECLRSLVASSWMSDVDIHTACGTVIPAHRLLLAARCPSLKRDSDFCLGNGRTVLKWDLTPFDAALQFLNFIYTGNIDIQENIVADLSYLANKYEVLDLQTSLQATKDSSTSQRELFDEISLNIDKAIISQKTEVADESQDEMNVDLDIVYNCINSSLKPSQQSSFYTQPTNFQKSAQIHDIPNEVKYKVYKSPESTTSDSAFKNDDCPTSPVIFDADKSENSSDEENPELRMSSSQKLTAVQSERAVEELDLCNSESNDSQKSVKFLKSSFTPNHSSHKSFDKEHGILSSPSSPEQFASPLKNSPSKIRDLSLASAVPHKFHECHLETDSILQQSHSEIHTFSFKEKNQILESDSEIIEECLNPPSRKPKIDDTLMSSPIRGNKDVSCDRFIFDKSCGDSKYKMSSKNAPCLENNMISPNSCKWVNYTPPGISVPSPDIIVDDFESSPKSLKSLPLSPYDGNTDLQTTIPFIADADLGSSFCDVQKRSNFSKSTNKYLGSPVKMSQENSFEMTSGKSWDVDKYEASIKSSPSLKNVLYPNSCKLLNCTPPRCSVSPEIIIDDCRNNSKSHKSLPSSPLDNLKLKIPCTETAKLSFSPWDFQKRNSFCEISNKHSGTPIKVFQENSCERNNSDVELISCNSDEDEPSIFNGLTGYCSRETKLDETIPHVAKLSENIVMNKNNSCKASVSSLESVDATCKHFGTDVAFQEKSSVFPLVSAKNTEQMAMTVEKNNATTPSSGSAGMQPRFQLSDSPITPLPDYKSMMTPEIKQALRKIGVKALPRKKAVALLSHVYDQTHPLVNGEINNVDFKETCPQKDLKEKVSKPTKRKLLGKDINKPSKKSQKEIDLQEVSPESDDSSSENPEWVGCVPEISFSQFHEDSPTKVNKDDIESIKEYVQSNEDLYNCILSYKPLNLVELHQELKDNGVKVSIQKLTDFLDEQCITFTCPRKEEYKKKQTARTQRFRKNMIAKLSQQIS